MARIRCPKCDKVMKKQPCSYRDFSLYKCNGCGKQIMRDISGNTYESPSAKRMRLGKEKREADRWAKKMGDK